MRLHRVIRDLSVRTPQGHLFQQTVEQVLVKQTVTIMAIVIAEKPHSIVSMTVIVVMVSVKQTLPITKIP